MRSAVLLLLCPCIVAILIHAWLRLYKPSAGGLSVDVLVGILSARHHYDLREAIRETWMGYLRDQPYFRHRVEVKFIVGRHGCHIPEEDKEDPYSCTLLNLSEPGAHVAGQEVEIVSKLQAPVLSPSDVPVISLDFRVLHPVVITQLGVFPRGPNWELPGNLSVTLFPLDQEEPVISVQFGRDSPGTNKNGVWYKTVEKFILPKGFEGMLLWEALDPADLTMANVSQVCWDTGGGVLKIATVEDGILPHRDARGFPGLAGGFTFSIYDTAGLSEMLQGRPGRMSTQESLLAQEEELLEQESQRHGDLVFVDMVDTYRNIPSKVLQFYKWSLRNTDFRLLLKTDDDCYIDVDAVLRRIKDRHLSRKNFWWGNFRQNWPVDRVGKWQELEYSSPVYPAFACGSGYVVSRDLVEWLAFNAEKLKAYQGEDVSMGIWMAALCPEKHQDSGWLCEQACYLDMLSSPQHTAEELRLLWRRKQACGDPCGCPWDLD
ncbi:UDP-GalNAc:beta-1,3-N-acetylgalactosaminyltransferase 2-like isoform X1 [Brienomyrus brachyistius]|uniref:UDP-GalNAc:beta-1, 3-N-acetylgalactosaminyltransferase 2-like isoform X1 n=1 Tax=Brienomyrus brachyistius TaxID=42636 RepID=UPI0020B381B4|nr:UDP-GalNAc:beta-1,3-N-acetylgalactosaminyltransferase 2-like isoform X1 [Brienomyrus brachyistius]